MGELLWDEEADSSCGSIFVSAMCSSFHVDAEWFLPALQELAFLGLRFIRLGNLDGRTIPGYVSSFVRR